MKKPLVHLAVVASLNAGALFCITLLTGCSAPVRQGGLMGGNTEYLRETPTRQVRHQTTDDSEEPARSPSARMASSRRVSTETVGTAPAPSPGPKKKVESEIRDPSELQIDDETRQRMDSNESKTAASNKKSKPRKVEAEGQNASDLQIDEQTKKQMDKPQ